MVANIQVNQAVQPYSRSYGGGVQLLQDTGFTPFSAKSPAQSALNQVFADFSRRLPGAGSATELEREFLNGNGGVRRALNLYDTLENAFSPRGSGEEAPIVSFLNERVDRYLSEKDADGNGSLSGQEIGLKTGETSLLDGNADGDLTGAEIKQGMVEGNSPLRRILDFFRNPPGQVVDLYA